MTTKSLLITIVILALVVGALIYAKSESNPTSSPTKQPPTAQTRPSHSESPHANEPRVAKVPAYQSAVEARELPPTLPAERFFGKTMDAYTVAKQIPKTLAQLPCYCHCDQGFGHKSLHTCFVDDHAAHCAVCVDEALLAYRLEKDQGLTPEQIRERIVEKYSAEHQHSH